MDYFERVKSAFLSFKTLMVIIILAILAVAFVSLKSNHFTHLEDNSESNVDEQVYPSAFSFKPVDDIDYSKFLNQGFADFSLNNDNQSWLNSIQDNSEYKYIHFDGVDYGVNSKGNTDYSLSFYKVSELDEDATYEIYIYTATTLSNIESRLGTDNCYWVSNQTILNAGNGFRVEYFGSTPCIPYTLVELIEYKDGKANIYDRVLITHDDAGVSVFRVLHEED